MAKRTRQQGELESLVLDALWDASEPLTSNQVMDSLAGEDLALTTVLTVLSRLEDKELARRETGSGRAHLYSATSTREEHAASQLLEIISSSDDQALTLSYFTAGLNKKSIQALKKILNEKK